MKKPISVFCLILILAVSFTGCDKTPSEVEVDDSVINIKDFWVYSGEEVVAKVENGEIFRFKTQESPEDYPLLWFPSTFGYELDEVNTYRGAKVGDNIEDLAEKYDGLLFSSIEVSPETETQIFRHITLSDFLALGENTENLRIHLHLYRIGDKYYQPTDAEAETFYDEAQKAQNEKSEVRYDRFSVEFDIIDGKVDFIRIFDNSFNSVASRGY